jgi:hypothetical protein
MQQQQRRKNNKSFSFIDAARMIDGICNLVCHPDNCHMYLYPKLLMTATTSVIADNTNNYSSSNNNNTNKVLSYYSKYWRFDTVGPTYTNPRTIYFSSIPKTKRIPPTRFQRQRLGMTPINNDDEEYFDDITQQSTMTKNTQVVVVVVVGVGIHFVYLVVVLKEERGVNRIEVV